MMDDKILDTPMRLSDLTLAQYRDSQSLDYCRWIACLGLTEFRNQADESFLQRWPNAIGATAVKKDLELGYKAVVPPGTTTGATFGAPLVGVAALREGFAKIVRSASLIGRLPGVRMVPFNTKCPIETGAATYAWVGETKVKPISAMAFDNGVTLAVLKALGIVVVTREFLRLAVPGSEVALRDTLQAGLVSFQDLSFLSPTSTAIAGVRPASITAGLTPTANTGNLQTDVQSLLNSFFTARPGAQEVSLIAGAAKAAQLRALNPGFGLPIIASEAAGGTVVVVDGAGIYVADGGVEIVVTDVPSVQMDTAPDDPVLNTTIQVSLFQINAVAYRTERYLNFKAVPNAVQYLAA